MACSCTSKWAPWAFFKDFDHIFQNIHFPEHLPVVACGHKTYFRKLSSRDMAVFWQHMVYMFWRLILSFKSYLPRIILLQIFSVWGQLYLIFPKVCFQSLYIACFNLIYLNPLVPRVPFLYPLKTSENHRFSDVFRGYKIGTRGTNGLR